MSRGHVRGAGVLTRLLQKFGILDVVVQYELNQAKFAVPLYRIPWDFKDLMSYEASFIEEFANALAPLRKVTLIDCGADIGIFPALLCSRISDIVRIIAFEPSAEACELLRINLSNLNVPSEVIYSAVSSFQGHGTLTRPEYDASDHARFLVPGDGPSQVSTIDSLGLINTDLAIKLDVEGGELEALRGARQTIAAARNCVVGLEANPAVKNRTGRDPLECLEFLVAIRSFDFIVAETGVSVDISRSILKNAQTQIWNIVGRSYQGH